MMQSGGILLVSASLHRMSQHFFRVARNPSRIDAKRAPRWQNTSDGSRWNRLARLGRGAILLIAK